MPHEMDDNLQNSASVGQNLYNIYCATCHQTDGKGDASRFPPLSETDWVTGDKDRLIETVLFGLEGEINVNGNVYNGIMPQHGFMKNDEVSAILTYIRENFGNEASPVIPAEIETVRRKL